MRSDLKLYGLFVGLNVTIMVTCDTLVYKVYEIGDFKITASGIVFSFCFLFSTLLTEVYGYRLAVRSIWIMVFCQSLYVILLNINALIQINNNEISKHYYGLYYDFWRVMIGSWLSVPISYFINGFIISKMKVIFSGQWFFVRYVLGSMCTQAALLLTSYPISLSGKYSFDELVNIISTTWSYKVVISILLLPLAIYLVGLVKRVEKINHFDFKTSYNPFNVYGAKKDKED
ncbi:VUT family protein [Candidatus Symbiopectobacterium sp. NZEC135]|uniref:VUT family protein n=1 Tax=Candidatus Symbiopectobacterium sp. NZEC135 TaxID=2820471 RepID=UPI002225C053|nr:VUT family protein [Candidatus Symbiopectobacterium sp. NZEC135]MCW2478559.1 VUT family protein [Candidatus Symbiopectobacterium sp. NZEC135]